MSSYYVREEFKTAIIAAFPTKKFADISGEFDVQNNFLKDNGIMYNDTCVLIDFAGGDEIPIAIPSNNNTGKFRETGSIFIYVVHPAKRSGKNAILIEAEEIRDWLRGKRLGSGNDILIDEISTPNFFGAESLQFEDGKISVTIRVSYERDLKL